MNSAEAIRFLRQAKGNYIKHYFVGASLYNDEADCCGDISQKVLENLKVNNDILFAGHCSDFWSDGYFILNKEKHKLIHY